MSEPMKVYPAIAAVMAELAVEGITKGRSNTQQGYKFRGIDDVFNALSPILSKHKLCMLPRILTRAVTERTTQKGGVLFYVVVEAEFDLISADDGSKHTIRTFGEAMDSADKATNKAMSAAYKYAAMQAFAIPTEGENDADATTHEIAPKVEEGPAEFERATQALGTSPDKKSLKAHWDVVLWELMTPEQTAALTKTKDDRLLALNTTVATKPPVAPNFDDFPGDTPLPKATRVAQTP